MFLILVAPLMTIQAQGNGKSDEAKAARDEAKANRQETKEEKCKNIESRIEAKLNKYENGNIAVEDVHKRLKERIRNIVTRLENNGIDASKLESDLAVLEQRIEQTAASYDTFIAALKESQSYACGESQSQFRAKIQEAKKLMVNVRTERKGTRDFIVTTIIPDIKSLREQIQAKVQEQNREQEQTQAQQ